MLITRINLNDLRSPMREAVLYLQALCRIRNLNGVIPSTGGRRSLEDQEKLYAIGRSSHEIEQRVKKRGKDGAVTDAPPGRSAHNWGLAVDIEGEDQGDIIELGKKIGLQTVSWDPAHLEYPNWQTLTTGGSLT